jgi:Tol biopolymer transport system component
VGGATWSADGQTLVFAVLNNGPGRPANASALFAVSADGRRVHRITTWDTSGVISSPAFSPDGKLVLFQIKPEGQDFGGNYYTIHPDGTDRRKLTNFPIGSILGSARWSRDGRWIVFANSGTAGNDDVFIMRANGSHILPLTRTAAWESAPTWVP